MSFSYIFDRIGKMDIGQKSLGSIGLVTSGIGLILEIFHCSEKRFNLIDSLMIWQMGLTMTIYSTEIFRGNTIMAGRAVLSNRKDGFSYIFK